jgi:light-regulated signal transduction histidine kinase (bacteriophytochrome)
VYAVMLIHHDITDLVAVNDKLIQKNKELERSNSELEQFAYVASHDLQEPLRKIRTYASLIETNINDSARVGSYLQKISSSAARMLNLIHDVLNYSRVRFNEDKFEVVDLNEVIRDIRSDFELMIEAKNARMLSSTLPQVFGSRTQLIQLFSNLIGNALKFSLEKPLIQISCQVRLDVFSPALNREADFYEITVNDNGIGFEPKFEEHIFEVFKRLHAQHEFGGNGIGLAICKRIVSNHQGLITAKSKPGEGSSFSILPPVKYQKSEQQVKIAVGESNV